MAKKTHSDYQNIELYRKKRKRAILTKRLIALAVILVLALCGYGIYNAITQGDLAGGNEDFPVKLNSDTIYECDTVGTHLALLTDKNLTFYSSKGTNIRTVNHSYAEPAMDCAGDLALIYDIGGTQFSVETTTGTQFSKIMDQNILLGKVSSNGTVAIVTNDSRYQCRLTVFNKTGEEIYKWYSAEGIVTDLMMDTTGSKAAVCTMNTKNGFCVSVVYGLDFSKTDETFRTEIPNSMAVGISYMGNRIQVICDDMLVVLDIHGNQKTSYTYPGTVKQYNLSSNKYTILLFGEDVKSSSEIVVLDANGEVVSDLIVDDTIRQITTDGTHIVTLGKEDIICYNMKLEQGAAYSGKGSSAYIAINGTVGYEMNTNNLNKFLVD